MFTGLIEELGSIKKFAPHNKGAEIFISCDLVLTDSSVGDSISVNGVCLTALDLTADSFRADVSQETLDRTTLGDLTIGTPVNLERAVTPATRLGGHIVQGHVDGRGTFVDAKSEGDFRTVTVAFSNEIARYMVEKGSISIDGISLTIAHMRESECDIAVIPKTWELTNLSRLKPGAPVNLEVDIFAKYVERMLSFANNGERI